MAEKTQVVDLAVEKAASVARKAAAFAEAEVAYEIWYQNVGTRVAQKTQGDAGIYRDVVLTTSPKCFCRKATVALGLCQAHYSAWWDRKERNVLGTRNQRSICHPDSKHHAYGLCVTCYNDTYGRHATKVRRLRDNLLNAEPVKKRRNAWRCKHTDRPHHSRGLCGSCRTTYRTKGIPLPPRIGRTFATQLRCIHKHRKHAARGLCKSCYSLWIQRKNHPERYTGRSQIWVKGWPPICGHEKHFAKGLCKVCYHKYRWEKEVTGRERVRTHYTGMRRRNWPKDMPLACGCVGVRHEAKGCCVKCYNKGVHKTAGFAKRVLEISGAA